eukprot:COSAG02_NODE_6572_length_3487_cov_3.480519_1_plen_103_part_00
MCRCPWTRMATQPCSRQRGQRCDLTSPSQARRESVARARGAGACICTHAHARRGAAAPSDPRAGVPTLSFTRRSDLISKIYATAGMMGRGPVPTSTTTSSTC